MENNNNINNEASFNICDEDFISGKAFNTEPNETENTKRKSKKNNTVVKNITWIVCTILLSVSLAFGLMYAGADYLGISFNQPKDVEVQIVAGSSIKDISKTLKDAGVIKLPWLFKIYSKTKEYDVRYQDGLYVISTESGYSQIADILVSKGYKAKVEKVTIPEGTGINDYVHYIEVDGVKQEKVIKGIATILEEKGVCKKSQFFEALEETKLKSQLLENCDEEKTYYTLEGYLFPDTYEFYAYDSKESARMVIQKMIENTETKITANMYKRAEQLGYNMNEILTMASIIQMEAGTRTEAMPYVASVFYNRLKSNDFSTLGSSPTCYYGNSFGKRDDGRYDTYEVEGLPPGPLCSPGLAAIEAALYPNETPYYYFITDIEGNFYYHRTLDEQNNKIAELKQQGKWVNEVF